LLPALLWDADERDGAPDGGRSPSSASAWVGVPTAAADVAASGCDGSLIDRGAAKAETVARATTVSRMMHAAVTLARIARLSRRIAGATANRVPDPERYCAA